MLFWQRWCTICHIKLSLLNKGKLVGKEHETLCPLSSPSFASHYITTADRLYLSSSILSSSFLLRWLPIQQQKTDNSGTYGGQEVMQINVSQCLYILAPQSPCREEVWGQLSIIGPQMISEEGLMQERKWWWWGGKCWRGITSEKAGDLNRTEVDGKTRREKGSAAVSRYKSCIFMTSAVLASQLCAMFTLFPVHLQVH